MESCFTPISSLSEFFRQGKKQTFRPKKRFEPGTLRYSLHKAAQASLHSGLNLQDAVKLPKGESCEDWIAVHVVDFFNRINLIYGTVSDYCNEESCPKMSGGSKFEYLWADGNKFKKPTALPAPLYVANLMDWIESQINDESIFPVKTEFELVSSKEFEPLNELNRRLCGYKLVERTTKSAKTADLYTS